MIGKRIDWMLGWDLEGIDCGAFLGLHIVDSLTDFHRDDLLCGTD